MTDKKILQASDCIKQGNPNQAISICQRLLSKEPNNQNALLILAIAHANKKEYDKSTQIFSKLLASNPSDFSILYNFAVTLQENNQYTNAIPKYKKCLAINPSFAPAWNNLGICYTEIKKFKDALEPLQKAYSLQTDNLNYFKNIPYCLYELKRFKEAYGYFVKLIQQNIHDSDDSYHCIDCLFEMRLTQSAYQLCKKTYSQNPNSNLAVLYAKILLKLKKYYEAADILNSDKNLIEHNVEGKLLLLSAYFYTNDHRRISLQKSILIETNYHDEALLFIVKLMEKNNEIKQARSLLKRNKVTSSAFDIIYSKLAYRGKKYKKALMFLKPKANQPSSSVEQLFLKGKIYNEIGKYKKAWKAYTKGNKLLAKQTNNKVDFNNFSETNRRICRSLNKVHQSQSVVINQNPSSNGINLIFIVGFPRTGTTLLETILENKYNAKILEETKEISNIFNHITNNKAEHYSSKIAAISSEKLHFYASNYYKQIANYTGFQASDIVIDKMPMNTIYLDLIYRLFPRAKVIFTYRHPYDIAISNLFQDTIHLYSIKEVENTYDSVMQIWKQVETELRNFKPYRLKYETLIYDFDNETKKLFQFLNFDNSIINTPKPSVKRMINTPSYDQVTQPLYKKSIYRYKHYLKYFPKNTPLLNKWKTYFHYE